MTDSSAILSLPYIQPSQAQKHVTHNEALQLLDLVVQMAVTNRDQNAPPVGPADGSRHIVATGATGAWAGQEGAIAVYTTLDGWRFVPPMAGWRAWVLSEARLVVWTGTAWEAATRLDQMPMLGINTSADATNRLAVSAAATLLTHEGADHQLKINKNAVADTASLLFQTGWSGRAEMGTAGNDGFSIKVSVNGASWVTALSFDPDTGLAQGAAVQQSRLDVTPGRLARADWVYGPGNLLGTVSQTGGVPGGAMIERGTNASGEFVRFADGTQICIHDVSGVGSDGTIGSMFRTASDLTWTFPRPFAAEPALTGNVDSGSSWMVFGGGTTTSVVYRRYSAVSDPTPRPVRLLAVGRWF